MCHAAWCQTFPLQSAILPCVEHSCHSLLVFLVSNIPITGCQSSWCWTVLLLFASLPFGHITLTRLSICTCIDSGTSIIQQSSPCRNRLKRPIFLNIGLGWVAVQAEVPLEPDPLLQPLACHLPDSTALWLWRWRQQVHLKPRDHLPNCAVFQPTCLLYESSIPFFICWHHVTLIPAKAWVLLSIISLTWYLRIAVRIPVFWYVMVPFWVICFWHLKKCAPSSSSLFDLGPLKMKVAYSLKMPETTYSQMHFHMPGD